MKNSVVTLTIRKLFGGMPTLVVGMYWRFSCPRQAWACHRFSPIYAITVRYLRDTTLALKNQISLRLSIRYFSPFGLASGKAEMRSRVEP